MTKYIHGVVRFLSPEKGGRQLFPVGDGYAPYVKTDNPEWPLAIRIYDLPMSGGAFDTEYPVTIELMYASKMDYGYILKGGIFEITEGRKVVGNLVIPSLD